MDTINLCEESQAVTIEQRKNGINAFSCDIEPCSGSHPEWHLQTGALEAYKSRHWDLVVSFPPCTHLAVSGARWFSEKRLNGSQENSINFFLDIWEISNAVENPVGIMSGGSYIKKWFPLIWQRMRDIYFPLKPSQIIQPWQFGHGETKATCLWLRGLPLLQPTNIVTGREQRVWKMPPSKDRAMLRSKTFTGIAKAIAQQYLFIK